MTELELALDALLADPLRAARAAGNALGFYGTDIPLDLLRASGRVSCHLPWSAERATPKADQWLETSFPGRARSVLEAWANGEFDCFGEVIFSRGEDSSQRLYYYICELQRRGILKGPKPLIFDIARIPRETSLRHTQSAVAALAQQLGIREAQLLHGIEQANTTRRAHAALLARADVSGVLLGKLSRASAFLDFASLPQGALAPATPAAGRVLLAGTAPPDERLHRAVAAARFQVTAELNDYDLRRFGPPIATPAEAAHLAIGRHCHGEAHSPRAFGDAAARLVARAQGHDAVVLWAAREDESLAWHIPAQRAALKAAGLPALVMTARRWDGADGAAQEIGDYLKGLNR